jgi:hypothetical protein
MVPPIALKSRRSSASNFTCTCLLNIRAKIVVFGPTFRTSTICLRIVVVLPEPGAAQTRACPVL